MTAPAAAASALRQRGDLDVLTWNAFEPFDVDVLVTTTRGGVSSGPYASLNLSLHVEDQPDNVLENRRRRRGVRCRSGRFRLLRQAHSNQAHVVTAADRGRGSRSQDDAIQDTDVLVTAEPGIVLAVMVADCVPIVLYDPVAHVLSCVHAGWRGTVARVSEAAVSTMRSLGARPENIIAAMGPAIPPDRYQVGEDVKIAAGHGLGAASSQVIHEDGTGKYLFDLWTANRLVLRDAGVGDDHITVAALPTGPPDHLFFSDRAARPCGRFAAIARLGAGSDRDPAPQPRSGVQVRAVRDRRCRRRPVMPLQRGRTPLHRADHARPK